MIGMSGMVSYFSIQEGVCVLLSRLHWIDLCNIDKWYIVFNCERNGHGDRCRSGVVVRSAGVERWSSQT